MPLTLKVAFVGAGYMATEHMRAFASLPDVEIAGIYSRTRERAEKLAALYGGSLTLDTAPIGGLRAELVLPAA